MKRIGFNQHYGLHDAVVVTETKTKTRRMEKCLGALYKTEEELGEPLVIKQQVITLDGIVIKTNAGLMALHTNYVIDDEVSVKLSGKDIYRQLQQRYGDSSDAALGFKEMYQGMTFWTNKMFTPADLCLDKVLITGIRVERLQDISDEDCLREGIYKDENGRTIGYPFGVPFYYTFYGAVNKDKKQLHWTFPREAFSVLIDKPGVGGKGTWKRNPWVVVYTFKLVK